MLFFSVTPCLRGEIPLLIREIRGRLYLPLNCAGRFSRNAVVPSFLSSEAQAHGEQHRFQIQALRQRHLHAFVHRFHGVLNRERSIGDDLLRNRLGAGNEFRGGSDFIHQSDAMRFLRADHFAGEHKLHGDPFADQPRQTLRAAVARNNSQLHLGLTELRVFAGQTHGASHRDFASAAEREAVDAGDHRLAQVLDQVEHATARDACIPCPRPRRAWPVRRCRRRR